MDSVLARVMGGQEKSHYNNVDTRAFGSWAEAERAEAAEAAKESHPLLTLKENKTSSSEGADVPCAGGEQVNGHR